MGTLRYRAMSARRQNPAFTARTILPPGHGYHPDPGMTGDSQSLWVSLGLVAAGTVLGLGASFATTWFQHPLSLRDRARRDERAALIEMDKAFGEVRENVHCRERSPTPSRLHCRSSCQPPFPCEPWCAERAGTWRSAGPDAVGLLPGLAPSFIAIDQPQCLRVVTGLSLGTSRNQAA